MNITEQLTPVNHDTGRNGHAITGIVLHTMVGWLQPSIDAAHNPGRQMSMNYCVGLNGQIVRVVRESDTAWCNANYLSNQTTISIEHEDGGDYNGSRTPELYEASAELVADICSRYGIPCNRDRIKGHREVIDKVAYPGGTACPDALDMDRIVARANEILNGGAAPAPAPAPASASGAIVVGTTVRPTRAVSYEGVQLQAFVTDRDYQVIEVRGDRAVLGNGLNTAFHASDLQIVSQTPAPAPTPAAPNHPYTVEAITPRRLVGDADRTEWNLDQTTWPGLSSNPAGKLPAGTPITAVAIAHHQLGSSYYMENADVAKGYNVVDLHDYVAPAPAPSSAPSAAEFPEIVWERLAASTTYHAKLQPTSVWGFNHTTYPSIEADVVRQLNKGDAFVAVGRAKHQLGSVYLMTAEDFGNADTSGKPNNYSGVNVVDLDGTPEAPGMATTTITGDAGETVTVTTGTPPAGSTEPVVSAPPAGTVVTPTPPVDPLKGTNADWRKTFKEAVKPLVSTATIIVKDLEGVLPDIKLEVGKLIPAAGHFWKDGEKYILTIPSHAKGNWYGIPSGVTGPVAKSQLRRAEQIVEDIWDKYYETIEDELDALFHEGLQFETEVAKGFEDLQHSGKLAGLDKVVDSTAKFLFGHSKNTKTTK